MQKPQTPKSPSGQPAPSAAGGDVRGPIQPFSMIWKSVQDAMNNKFSKGNLPQTIIKIKDLEKTYGPYKVGEFNSYLIENSELPMDFSKNGGWVKFKKDFQDMPQNKRDSVSLALRQNFDSNTPLPVVFQTSLNVSPSHDAIVTRFNYNSEDYIGVLYLCANPNWPK